MKYTIKPLKWRRTSTDKDNLGWWTDSIASSFGIWTYGKKYVLYTYAEGKSETHNSLQEAKESATKQYEEFLLPSLKHCP